MTGAALALAALHGSGDAHADAAAAPRGAVEVVVVGNAEDVDALRGSLGELLARLGLTMRFASADALPPAPSGDAPGVVARVQIDARGDAAKVALFDARPGRAPIRRVVTLEGSRAVLLEDVAHVVQSEIESIVATPAERPVAPPPPPLPTVRHEEDAAPVARATPWSIDLATFASGTSFARESGAVFGAGVAARGALGREALKPALWLGGQYHFPFGNFGLIELRVSAWSLRATPTLQLFATPRVLVEAGAGGGVDVLRMTPGAALRLAQKDGDRTDVSAMLTTVVAAHYRFSTGSSAFVAATLDFDLAPRDYQVSEDGVRRSLVHAYAVRPGLTLGFTFDVVGSGR